MEKSGKNFFFWKRIKCQKKFLITNWTKLVIRIYYNKHKICALIALKKVTQSWTTLNIVSKKMLKVEQIWIKLNKVDLKSISQMYIWYNCPDVFWYNRSDVFWALKSTLKSVGQKSVPQYINRTFNLSVRRLSVRRGDTLPSHPYVFLILTVCS